MQAFQACPAATSWLTGASPRLSTTTRRPVWAAQPRVPQLIGTSRHARLATGARTSVRCSAAKEQTGDAPQTEIVLDENIGGFCSINPRTGKREEISLEEKERLFLDAMQAFYRGENVLSNEEFDTLKEELTWQGSEVTTLSRDEFKFLDAVQAFETGKPVMSDEEFDALKNKLRRQGSVVSIQRGPRCSVRRQITFSDVVPDNRRLFALYVPAGLVFGLVWLSAAFEFTPLRNIDPVLSLIIGSPIIYLAAKFATGLVLPDPLIVVGDCPNCGRRTRVFFGKVLNVDGYKDVADVTCDKCKAQLSVERETNRMILVKQ